MSGVFWDSSDPQGAAEIRPLALWTLTLDGRVQYANTAAAEVQGHGDTPRPWRDCWPEERRFLADRALSPAQAATIERDHRDVMRRFGYL